MATARTSRRLWPNYRTIWRWHFYAGVMCIPIVLMLSCTGMVLLFRPQINALINWRVDHLVVSAHQYDPVAEAHAALAAVPGSTLLAYQVPPTDQGAARVVVLRHGQAIWVFVDPSTLAILETVPEEWRFTRIMFNLHGQLLLGNGGSLVVELVASWAIVMILTGLCLWWPRPTNGRLQAAGLLYPRLRAGGRAFWRDLHSVIGLWASFLVLFLLVSGLPWSYAWGNYFKTAWSLAGPASPSPDWQVGHVPARFVIAGTQAYPVGMRSAPSLSAHALDSYNLDRVVAAVRPLHLADPMLVTPPMPGSTEWRARSNAQDRLVRITLVLSPRGRILRRADFNQRPLIDRVVGVGVAIHEGRLFGWPNVVLNAFAALSMIIVSVSGLKLWLTRRPHGRLGAPPKPASRPVAWVLTVPVIVLAVALPMFGVSFVLVWLVERLVLRRLPAVATWLGLDRATALRA